MPPNLKATIPALLAVALIVIGSSPKTPLPPVKIKVEAAGAATAAPAPKAPPARAMAPIASPAITFFIIELLLVVRR
jgi:hypothetical protein